MEIVLLRTEGRGGEAEVEVNGAQLMVVDALSPADAPTRPGKLPGARLEVVAIPKLSWIAPEDAPEAAPLRRERGWRYRARARVLATEPLQVDLGAFTAALELPLRGEITVGALLDLAIDRIVLSAGSTR
jgi:hypothetical protein